MNASKILGADSVLSFGFIFFASVCPLLLCLNKSHGIKFTVSIVRYHLRKNGIKNFMTVGHSLCGIL